MFLLSLAQRVFNSGFTWLVRGKWHNTAYLGSLLGAIVVVSLILPAATPPTRRTGESAGSYCASPQTATPVERQLYCIDDVVATLQANPLAFKGRTIEVYANSYEFLGEGMAPSGWPYGDAIQLFASRAFAGSSIVAEVESPGQLGLTPTQYADLEIATTDGNYYGLTQYLENTVPGSAEVESLGHAGKSGIVFTLDQPGPASYFPIDSYGDAPWVNGLRIVEVPGFLKAALARLN
jgi:hypothetical protein